MGNRGLKYVKWRLTVVLFSNDLRRLDLVVNKLDAMTNPFPADALSSPGIPVIPNKTRLTVKFLDIDDEQVNCGPYSWPSPEPLQTTSTAQIISGRGFTL